MRIRRERPTSCSTTRLYPSVSSAHRRMRPAVSVSFLLRSCKAAFGGRHLSEPRICAVDSANFAVQTVFLPFVRKEGKAERRILKGRNFILHLAYFNGFYMYDNSSQMYYILCNETRWINSYYDNVFKTIVITKVRFIKF